MAWEEGPEAHTPPPDPIAQSFHENVVRRVAAMPEDEAIEWLARFIDEMDDDLKELLLERRRRLCSNLPEAVRQIEMMEAQALFIARIDRPLSKMMLAKGALMTLYLAQCTEKWPKLTPRERAWILVPLYKASAVIDDAENLIREALARGERPDPARLDELSEEASYLVSEAMRRMEKKNVMAELEDILLRLSEGEYP